MEYNWSVKECFKPSVWTERLKCSNNRGFNFMHILMMIINIITLYDSICNPWIQTFLLYINLIGMIGVLVLYCLSKINVYPQFKFSEWEGILCNILRIWNIYLIIIMGARCYIKYSTKYDDINALCTVSIKYIKIDIHSDSAAAILNLWHN